MFNRRNVVGTAIAITAVISLARDIIDAYNYEGNEPPYQLSAGLLFRHALLLSWVAGMGTNAVYTLIDGLRFFLREQNNHRAAAIPANIQMVRVGNIILPRAVDPDDSEETLRHRRPAAAA